MAKKRSRSDQLQIGYHALAFLDLLGQQEELRKLRRVPDHNEVKEGGEFVESLRSTYGAIHDMRKDFQRYFDGFHRAPNIQDKVPKEKRAVVKTLVSSPIRVNQFSDFVVAFVSLRTDLAAKLPVLGVYGLIGAAAATSLVGLARGRPIRGGVDIGVGVEVKHNEVYGSALARAYALESHVANYPRVVVGRELISYLEQTAQQCSTDDVTAVAAATANQCLKMIDVDDDGYPYVDFLGEAIREEQESVPEMRESVVPSLLHRQGTR